MPRSKAKGPAPRPRKQSSEVYDKMEFELLHARAVLMTAVLALQGNGVHDHVSIALRGCDCRLATLQEALEALSKRPVVRSSMG